VTHSRTGPATLRELLACPVCRGGLDWGPERIVCADCGQAYGYESGVPVLLAPDALDAAKIEQARYFDQVDDPEFELLRPHTGTRLYDWLLAERFRRSTSRMALRGATILVVCGGSGMDAELFTEAGAAVISTDVSVGAALRARQRAATRGLDLLSVVADAERLPFADRSIELVSVHDGLHHLERPLAGVDEMARVASRAIVIAEPADAAVTNLAVRLGLALVREEPGNAVRRLRARDVARALRSGGLEVVSAKRFAMYYRHVPGRTEQALSRALPFALVRLVFRLVNAVAGRFGNKLAVQAVRSG
jgi:uncharacterized protein YbaR (Trm112 family)